MMASNMDRGLDEIIADSRSSGPRNRHNGGGGPRRPRHNDRQEYPRDGVRKSFRSEAPRNLDSEWVHDRFEDDDRRRAPAPRRRRESPPPEARGTKIRVDNIHWDLTEEDLDGLFRRIGPVLKLNLRYDRAGRSEGTAYVVYESKRDADEAIKEFDGANAHGQPIRLTILPSGPSRNPFDGAFMPGKPLADRIGGQARSASPGRKYSEEDAARKGIDRYVPGRSNSGSRSPVQRRGRGGRRPGARREPGARDQERRGGDSGGNGGGNRSTPRQKKTQDELDAEMADYFGGEGGAAESEVPTPIAAAGVPAASAEDVDMIE